MIETGWVLGEQQGGMECSMKLLNDPCAKIRFRALLKPPSCMEKVSTNLGTAAKLESSEGQKIPKATR